MTWSPWHAAPARGEDAQDADGVGTARGSQGETEADLKLRRAWRLQADCLRVATYYRVMHSQARAEERRCRTLPRARFQRWAATVLSARRQEEQQQSAADAATTERQRRGARASAGTRMACTPPDVYRSGIRKYKPRDARHVINARILRKPHRARITGAAEIGPRLWETFMEIARRCNRDRGDG